VAISLDAQTGYLPPGPHSATAGEIERVLVADFPASSTRRPLFDGWRVLCEAVETIVPIDAQWIGGSFVSTKPDPADIDLVSHFDGPTVDALAPASKMLLRGLVAGRPSRDLHGYDSFQVLAYPNGHPARAEYEYAAAYWERFFSHDRDGNSRGYVVVDRE